MSSTRFSELATDVRQGLSIGLAIVAIVIPASTAQAPPAIAATSSFSTPRFADFTSTQNMPSPDARFLANWVADSRNNDGGNAGFIIIDKKFARVYVFDASGRLRADSAVLLGGARGDDSVEGIGNRPIEQVRPEERTTPAGRFVAEPGRNMLGEDVVWIDYDAAVSMHRVRLTNPAERRLERLATPTADDNRISYGCINVPVTFYETYIRPAAAKRRAIIYVLPEVHSLQQVFGAYDVAAARGVRPAP